MIGSSSHSVGPLVLLRRTVVAPSFPVDSGFQIFTARTRSPDLRLQHNSSNCRCNSVKDGTTLQGHCDVASRLMAPPDPAPTWPPPASLASPPHRLLPHCCPLLSLCSQSLQLRLRVFLTNGARHLECAQGRGLETLQLVEEHSFSCGFCFGFLLKCCSSACEDQWLHPGGLLWWSESNEFCDGIGIARILNATLVLPKFEVAAYWNESSGFADVFDVDYFIQQTQGSVDVVKELPEEIASREPFRVDCSKRRGQFDYIEAVLPVLLEHHYISLTPAMSQRRDRYPLYAKAPLCQGCYNALRLNKALEAKGSELFKSIPKPFLSLHLRFEPDMVAYSQCEYNGLSSASSDAIDAARGDRKPWTGDAARAWRNRGKCPLTPNETAFILQSLKIPKNTTIYLAAGDGLMEMEGFTSIYNNVYTKSSLLNSEDFVRMHGNTKAALDYYVSIHSDAYVATYFGNMDKMVSAMRAANGHYRTLALSRRAFANFTAKGLEGVELADALWKSHREDFVMGRGTALPDCFCQFTL